MAQDIKKQKKTAYWDYLALDRIVSLQQGFKKDENDVSSDELLFIIVHQTYELWFKQIIREFRLVRDQLNLELVPENTIPFVDHHLNRVVMIFRLAIEQFNVLETLSPQEFLAFRSELGTASGFQSIQMREMEILMGLEDSQRVSLGKQSTMELLQQSTNISPTGSAGWKRIEKARSEKSLKDVVYAWLYRTPINGSIPIDNENDEQIVSEFINDYIKAYQKMQESQADLLISTGVENAEVIRKRFLNNVMPVKDFLNANDIINLDEQKRMKRIRAAILFIESYRELPLLAWPRRLLNTIVELEQQFILWRTRHARMVERIIGRRVGTGGSEGVDYLDQTAKYRIFQNLWAVRTSLLPKEMLPELKTPEFYQFATQD